MFNKNVIRYNPSYELPFKLSPEAEKIYHDYVQRKGDKVLEYYAQRFEKYTEEYCSEISKLKFIELNKIKYNDNLSELPKNSEYKEMIKSCKSKIMADLYHPIIEDHLFSLHKCREKCNLTHAKSSGIFNKFLHGHCLKDCDDALLEYGYLIPEYLGKCIFLYR